MDEFNLKQGDAQVIAIIGAGQTGRGFVARLAAAANYSVVFIDKSDELVKAINQEQMYKIHFFSEQKDAVTITGVSAALIGTPKAADALAKARLTFTAVGEQNLLDLAESIYQAVVKRTQLGAAFPFRVITCENGTAPGELLRQALQRFPAVNEKIQIGEAAVFCSTIHQEGTRLDICSESYDELPFDQAALPDLKAFPGLVPVQNFRSLLTRKIYTYNCISACIAYLGAFKGYEMYADAANDPDIRGIVMGIVSPLNQSLCKKLELDPADQHAFAERALRKFSDPNIRDDIARNARDVRRKLGQADRMIGPALLIMQNDGPIEGIALVIASALHYTHPSETDIHQKIQQEGIAKTLSSISGLSSDHPLLIEALFYYEQLEKMSKQSTERFQLQLSSLLDLSR